MQETPDTGGGLSGFIAWLLWQVYQYFPFEGTWDWLLLFIFVAVVTRLLAVPSSWKLAKWIVADTHDREMALYVHNLFAQTGVMFLFIWFFSTEVGHTFLVGRTWFGGIPVLETNRRLWLSATLFLVTGFGFGFGCIGWVEENLRGEELYMVFAVSSVLHVLIVLGAHVFYWYWSVASLILMWLFSLTDWAVVFGLFFWYARRAKQGKT